jgi:malonyl-CoA O-methyltransferase
MGSAALRERYPDAQVIALDLAVPMLRAAARRAGSSPAFACVAGDAQALPLADASVDLVHSNLCLQWCETRAWRWPSSAACCAREACCCSRPSGRTR